MNWWKQWWQRMNKSLTLISAFAENASTSSQPSMPSVSKEVESAGNQNTIWFWRDVTYLHMTAFEECSKLGLHVVAKTKKVPHRLDDGTPSQFSVTSRGVLAETLWGCDQRQFISPFSNKQRMLSISFLERATLAALPGSIRAILTKLSCITSWHVSWHQRTKRHLTHDLSHEWLDTECVDTSEGGQGD